MAENVILNNLANLQNDTTTISVINGNNATITSAFTDVLSRTGVQPNQMNTFLDMNNFPIMNLPAPGSANSPARLSDVTSTNPINISLSLSGDVTAPASSGVLTTTIPAGTVTGSKIASNTITNTNLVANTVNNASLAQAAAFTVKGNPTSSTANEQDTTNPVVTTIQLGQNGGTGGTLQLNGATSGNATVTTSANGRTWTLTPDVYQFFSPTTTGQPTFVLGDLTGSGWAINFDSVNTNNVGGIGATINGGYSVRTPGAEKGDLDFIAYTGLAGTIGAHVGLSAASTPPAWLPANDNAYGNGTVGQRWQSTYTYAFGAGPPNTQTGATYTIVASDYSIINNNAAGTLTLTFPTASLNIGRIFQIKTTQAQAVVSASANVVPIGGGAAATAILAATSGKWATLQSDGTNWITMASN